MPRLIVHRGRAGEKAFEIREGVTSVGRTADNAVCIEHPSLSRKHARIERRGAQIEIVDLGSMNGVFVNGVRLERAVLSPGDAIQLGEIDLVFEGGQASAAPTWTRGLETAFFRATQLDMPRVSQASERLQVLLQVSQILSSPGSISTLLEKILDLAFQILDVDRAAVLLATESGALEPRVVRSRVPTPGGQRIWSESIVDWVRERGVAALFADAMADPRIDPTRSVIHLSICASMCAPLRSGDAVLGVLYVDSVSSKRRLSEEDLELFTAFANQAAIALENSRLHERVAEEAALRSHLLRFFPPATIQKIVEAKGPLPVVDAEVTALFCDLSGFTALSERLQPREVLDLLNEYFPLMAEIVFRHEGTLEKFIGDAILAVWGAPFAHDDDADRAVRAAVEMQQATKGRRFGIHIGLHTGRVAAGNVGSDHYLQYATVGDTTNIASRLCGAAAETEIVISDATAQKLRESHHLEAIGPIALKGREAPIEVHQVRWAR